MWFSTHRNIINLFQFSDSIPPPFLHFYIRMNILKELLLHGRGQVLGHAKRFDGNVDIGHSSRFNAVGAEVGNAFLDGDVVGILHEEVRLCIVRVQKMNRKR